MNVLSLFDGMSCGQLALDKLDVPIDNYFASELKKIAIDTTQLHFPNTIQVGDATKLKENDLPKIDLLIGGSPCQDFSRGNKTRDGLKGTKSSLFFHYLRLRDILKPKYWLLENVMMDETDYQIISNYLGCYPVRINSNRITAAHRDRFYWTNIGRQQESFFGLPRSIIPQPKEKYVNLQSILTSGYTDLHKARCLLTNDGASVKNIESLYKRYRTTGMVTIIFDSPDFEYRKGIRVLNKTEREQIQTVPKGYTQHLTDTHAFNLLGDGWTVDVISHILSFMK